jgi:hypothetical protein
MDLALAPGGSQAEDVPIVKMLQVGYVIEAGCGSAIECMGEFAYVSEVAYGVGALVAAYMRCCLGDYREGHRIDVEDSIT